MIEIVIIILLILVCCNTVIYSINSRCPGDRVVIIDKIYGSRISGIQLARKLGFPTINLKLNKPVPCGFYNARSKHGPVTIIVGKVDRYRADVHFLDFNDAIEKQDSFIFSDMKRIVNQDSDIISTFNRGCC